MRGDDGNDAASSPGLRAWAHTLDLPTGVSNNRRVLSGMFAAGTSGAEARMRYRHGWACH